MMRAFCLGVVVLVARVLATVPHGLPLTPDTGWALAREDLLVVLLFAAFADGFRHWTRVVKFVYASLVLIAALNLPLQRVFTWPLTPPMLVAADRTLGDSIGHYGTLGNVGAVFIVLLLGWILPRLLARRTSPARPRWLPVLLFVSVASVVFLESSPLPGGLGQNPLLVWTRHAMRDFPTLATDEDFRRSDEVVRPEEDLRSFRGRLAGFNVVLVILESAGAEHLAEFGGSADPMPTLTRLAQTGLAFTQAFCVYPESVKGLMALLCSVTPALDVPPEAYENVHVPSLAQLLADRGYTTALFHSGRFDYLGMPSIVQRRGFHRLADAGDLGGVRESSFGVDEETTVDKMLTWVAESVSPFFLTYIPVAGHHPYDSPSGKPFDDSTEFGRSQNALRYADSALARLLQGLTAQSVMDQTLVIVVGDHGQAFGRQPGNWGHTFFLFEDNVHIPLVFSAKVLPSMNRVIPRTVSSLDVVPTILDLLGLPTVEEHDGRTLLDPTPRRAFFFTDYGAPLLGFRDGPIKVVLDLSTEDTVITNPFVDRAERAPLTGVFGERRSEWRDLLKRWSAAQRARIRFASVR